MMDQLLIYYITAKHSPYYNHFSETHSEAPSLDSEAPSEAPSL